MKNQAKYLGILETYKQEIKIHPESDKAWRLLADLINLEKSAENLSLLLGEIELATKQNDIQRVHKRLKTALPLLTKTRKRYVYLPFLAFIVDPEQSFQTILSAIEALQEDLKLEFNFTDFNSIIERQSVTKQQLIHLFMDYFKQRIDLLTLKQKLNESQDNSNNLSETLLNQ